MLIGRRHIKTKQCTEDLGGFVYHSTMEGWDATTTTAFVGHIHIYNIEGH